MNTNSNTRRFVDPMKRPHASFEANRQFRALARNIAPGHIGVNVLRWRMANNRRRHAPTPAPTHRCDSCNMFDSSWVAPSVAFQKKVEFGTVDGPAMDMTPDQSWADATKNGMVLDGGTLIDSP